MTNVRRQGLKAYLPRMRCNQRGKETVVPLFPGYLFIEPPTTNRALAALNSTRGLKRVIMSSNEKPASIPVEEIMRLMALEDDKGVIDLPEEQRRGFRRGQSVRVKSGPMFGLCGVVKFTRGSERVRVLLNFLGRRTPVDVGARVLEHA